MMNGDSSVNIQQHKIEIFLCLSNHKLFSVYTYDEAINWGKIDRYQSQIDQ